MWNGLTVSPFHSERLSFNASMRLEITAVSEPFRNRPMTPGASSSGTAFTPTYRHRGPGKDPTSCLPLPLEQRLVVERWVKARFRDHRDYYDTKNTNEERIANPPLGWPDDQWKWVVAYWVTERFKKLREQAKKNKKESSRHTGGSRGFQTRKYDIMLKTGRPVDQIRFYKDMRTKKADKSYVDEKSRQNAELMDELAQECTDEEGNLTIPTQEIVTDVIGIKRGREPLEGRVPPKMTKVIEDLLRVQEEAYAEVDRVREETTQEIQTMQSQINSTVRQAFREMMMRDSHPNRLPLRCHPIAEPMTVVVIQGLTTT